MAVHPHPFHDMLGWYLNRLSRAHAQILRRAPGYPRLPFERVPVSVRWSDAAVDIKEHSVRSPAADSPRRVTAAALILTKQFKFVSSLFCV